MIEEAAEVSAESWASLFNKLVNPPVVGESPTRLQSLQEIRNLAEALIKQEIGELDD
jgi:hypothetical protein